MNTNSPSPSATHAVKAYVVAHHQGGDLDQYEVDVVDEATGRVLARFTGPGDTIEAQCYECGSMFPEDTIFTCSNGGDMCDRCWSTHANTCRTCRAEAWQDNEAERGERDYRW